MGKLIVLLLVIAGIYYAASDSTAYRAEVGYYEGSDTKWWYGGDTDREACTAEAIGFFNRKNAGNPGRAFSWSCLVVKGDRILSRVR
jgi:hypothetical protein